MKYLKLDYKKVQIWLVFSAVLILIIIGVTYNLGKKKGETISKEKAMTVPFSKEDAAMFTKEEEAISMAYASVLNNNSQPAKTIAEQKKELEALRKASSTAKKNVKKPNAPVNQVSEAEKAEELAKIDAEVKALENSKQ